VFAFTIKKLFVGLLVMLAVSAITFTLTNVAADPARTLAGEGATSADVEAIRTGRSSSATASGSARRSGPISATPTASGGRSPTSSSSACRSR
jgi:hypothetical protein